MSLRFASAGGYAQRTGAANLGSVTAYTVLGWYFKEDSTADHDIITAAKGGQSKIWRINSSTQIKAGLNSEAFTNTTCNNSEWVGL